jgi:anti-sigma factor (TIGR02949 family)
MTDHDPLESTHPAPIDCEHAVRRLWDYLDGRLPTIARDEVQAHLATCEGCAPHFTFARSMQQLLAASGAPRVPAGDDDRLRERVRNALGRFRAREPNE